MSTKNSETSDVLIPGPPGRRFIGNLWDIDFQNTMDSLRKLTDVHGPIWKFHLGNEERIVVGSQALLNEVCDETRFVKVIAATLNQARNGVQDGLGTAHGPKERNWGIAHRILAPHFRPIAIQDMFGGMQDTARQLVLKDFTRLTLNVIALCTIDFCFNSFYREDMHLLVDALEDFLKTNADCAKQSAIGNIKRLRETAHKVINRKKHSQEKKDLLQGVNPLTKKQMTADSIVDNIITFLFASHETTSGLLSFTFYYLLSNPATYARAQQEVDDIIGRDDITHSHLARLPYLAAVLRKLLRLSPTVKAKAPIIALIASVHRDTLVYRNDADDFQPDRMLDSDFDERNRHMQGCIGRIFAWQQALLVTAVLLDTFNLTISDPSYRLRTKQTTITMKPEGFRMRARLRPDVALLLLGQPLSSTTIADTKAVTSEYYGSNRTCEQLACQLASRAGKHGFAVGNIGTLNSARGNLSRKNPVVIIAASYNGQPAINAAEFVAWVQTLDCNELTGVAFAVFGCGHHDWAKTFLKVPKYLDGEEGTFWPAVQKRFGDKDVLKFHNLEVDLQVQMLSCNEFSVKKHLELSLPQGMPYRTGDYLVILPQNARHEDSILTISSATSTVLPLHAPIRAAEVLRAYVELEQTASKRNILDMSKVTDDETAAAELSRLAGEAYHEEVDVKRLSLLDLLERFPAVKISPGAFLSMQPPMSTRQYSILSSPLWKASCATVTYCATGRSSTYGHLQPSQVASAYLSSLAASDEVFVCVAECADEFRMPEAAENVPLVLRKYFIQERAAQLATGRTLAEVLLFYGCRSRVDDLYFDSFQRWQDLGAVAIHRAYSSVPDQSQGCRYVQDRIYHNRAAVMKLLVIGARIIVCVPGCAVAEVRETLTNISREIKDVRT
ncbi:cytochrome P450 [Melanomma pulvis-pyrius CBS 109.77]|uniref:Cytochrome P450 n=1 Tax=Melanomma pulvis-pyrius CBS 109.77 TaxID=1314802 RepID=A0A6A6WSD5_9PLEO|nr:cytochrome P450 [Melanomma pulvis-pyrius CBS 109.77]